MTATLLNNTIFSDVGLPSPGNVVLVTATSNGDDFRGLSYPNLTDIEARSNSLSGLQPFFSGTQVSIGRDGTGVATAAFVGYRLFKLLGTAPAAGALFDGSAVDDGSVIISWRLFESTLGGKLNPDSHVHIGGREYLVRGVMPVDFTFPDTSISIWFPITQSFPDIADRSRVTFWGIGRLSENSSLDLARKELGSLARELNKLYPAENTSLKLRVETWRDFRFRDLARGIRAVAVLSATLVALSVIAIWILLSVIAWQARRDVAVALSCGAPPWWPLAVLSLIPTALLLLSSVVAIVATQMGLRLWQQELFDPGAAKVVAPDASYWLIAVMSLAVLLIGVAVSVGWPSRKRLSHELRLVSISSEFSSRSRFILLLGVLSAAIALSTTAGIMAVGAIRASRLDLGFKGDGVVVVETRAPDNLHNNMAARIELLHQTATFLRSLPGVEHAGVSYGVPGRPGLWRPQALGLNGRLLQDLGTVTTWWVGSDYLTTLGVTIQGQDLSVDQETSMAPVAIASASLARTIWGQEDAVGKELDLMQLDPKRVNPRQTARERLSDPTMWNPQTTVKVIGIANDVRLNSFNEADAASLFVSYTAFSRPDGSIPGNPVFVLRVSPSSELAPIVDAAKAELGRLAPSVAVARVYWLSDSTAMLLTSTSTPLLVQWIAAALVVGAFIVSVASAYALGSQCAIVRQREFRIRLACGASESQLQKAVVGEVLRVGAVALPLASIAIYNFSRALEHFFQFASRTDVVTSAAVSAVLVSVLVLGAATTGVRQIMRWGFFTPRVD